MQRIPGLNGLRAFEVAGRHLNFRLAAEEIGVTQGAVAQQVRALEARLGVQLFHRLPRGLALTEAGRRYHSPIKRAFQLITDATEALSDRPHSLTISVTPTFASKWLVPRLGEFTSLHPEIDVRVSAVEVLANFQSDGVDIAVRQGRPPFGPGLLARSLFDTEYVAVCSPVLCDTSPGLQAPKDLANHTLLNDAHGLWSVFLEHYDARITPRTMEFSQTGLAIDAAVAGQGVALANSGLVAEELRAGRLVRPFKNSLTSDLGFYVVHPRAPRHPDLVEKFTKWLVSQS